MSKLNGCEELEVDATVMLALDAVRGGGVHKGSALREALL